MAKKSEGKGRADLPVSQDARQRVPTKQKPSAFVDTRVIYCGDSLEKPKIKPDQIFGENNFQMSGFLAS